jgi:hypothetical protein
MVIPTATSERMRTYENRRRVRGDRNKRLQKLRSELTERTFAHLYETGGMRRVHLQGRKNILKRLLVHGVAFNLSLILRKMIGVGKPRRLQGLCLQLFTLLENAFARFDRTWGRGSQPRVTLWRKVSEFVTVLPPVLFYRAA